MVNAFFVMTGINFFGSIPESMIEAAKIDGASEFKVLTKVVLPVSKPFLATLSLFAAVGQWNSWLDAAYYVRDSNLHTLSYKVCLLYTSDAADDLPCGDLSGRRLIKKKKTSDDADEEDNEKIGTTRIHTENIRVNKI